MADNLIANTTDRVNVRTRQDTNCKYIGMDVRSEVKKEPVEMQLDILSNKQRILIDELFFSRLVNGSVSSSTFLRK